MAATLGQLDPFDFDPIAVLERASSGHPVAIDEFDRQQTAAHNAHGDTRPWLNTLSPIEAEAMLITLDQIAREHRGRANRAEELRSQVIGRFAEVLESAQKDNATVAPRAAG